jgi:hypothetical protein
MNWREEEEALSLLRKILETEERVLCVLEQILATQTPEYQPTTGIVVTPVKR